jgi:hypothetical protein
MALFAALVALLVVTALVAASWVITFREQQAADAALRAGAALDGADLAAASAAAAWQPSAALTLPTGGVVGPSTTTLAGGAQVTWLLQRLTATLFWATGDATQGTGKHLAHRTVSLALRLALPEIPGTATLTARDSVRVRPGALVVGVDSTPPWWAGVACPASSNAAGVAAPDTTRVCDGTCGSAAGGIVGSPPVVTDPSAADTLHYLQFGDESWASLTGRASVVLPPNATVTPMPLVSAGSCDRTASANWGDPHRATACADYFPIIRAQGDLVVRGGRGQGILLVDGDVTFENGAEFAGVVITQDDVVIASSGAQLLGLVLAADRRAGSGDHTDLHAGVVTRSSCAVDRALTGSAPLVPVKQRSWAPMY